ncbi:hypothetical protein [Defluviitalea phaphyphila]|uniref:hypothetical protein n=1 Tax=Defluviitalea phaphyphila TaxID=1473580 RepID=UPI00072FCA34|nr:hypothetical protein [Defluviitalea phaphyphila]
MKENKAIIKHVFPGGNTPKGFVSFYDNILFQEEANKIIIIKGGPGVGKSSFMKKISEYFFNLGYDLEHHHCSSDNNSLDGLVIPKLKVAILDGTSPHVVDPINPGAIDKILNLGDYWNEEKIRENKDKIMNINKEIGRLFQKAYNYLKASYVIYKSAANTENLAFDEAKANFKANNIINSIYKDYPIAKKLGKDRHLFGAAITPNGLVEYLNTIIGNTKKIYMIKDSPGSSAKSIMKKIYKEALIRGLNVECYHSPIDIDKIEDIIIPELDTAITVVNNYHKACVSPTNILDFTSFFNKAMYKHLKSEIDRDIKLFDDLLQKAIVIIKEAKKAHDEMEKYYIPNMNFKKINELIKDTIEDILSIEKNS